MTDGFVHYLASQCGSMQGSVGPGTQMSSTGNQSHIQDHPTEDADNGSCASFKGQLYPNNSSHDTTASPIGACSGVVMTPDSCAEGIPSTVNFPASPLVSSANLSNHCHSQPPSSDCLRPAPQRRGSQNAWNAAESLCNYAAAQRNVDKSVPLQTQTRLSKLDHQRPSFTGEDQVTGPQYLTMMQRRDGLKSLAITSLGQVTAHWPENGNFLTGLDVEATSIDNFVSTLLAKSEQARSRQSSMTAGGITVTRLRPPTLDVDVQLVNRRGSNRSVL